MATLDHYYSSHTFPPPEALPPWLYLPSVLDDLCPGSAPIRPQRDDRIVSQTDSTPLKVLALVVPKGVDHSYSVNSNLVYYSLFDIGVSKELPFPTTVGIYERIERVFLTQTGHGVITSNDSIDGRHIHLTYGDGTSKTYSLDHFDAGHTDVARPEDVLFSPTRRWFVLLSRDEGGAKRILLGNTDSDSELSSTPVLEAAERIYWFGVAHFSVISSSCAQAIYRVTDEHKPLLERVISEAPSLSRFLFLGDKFASYEELDTKAILSANPRGSCSFLLTPAPSLFMCLMDKTDRIAKLHLFDNRAREKGVICSWEVDLNHSILDTRQFFVLDSHNFALFTSHLGAAQVARLGLDGSVVTAQKDFCVEDAYPDTSFELQASSLGKRGIVVFTKTNIESRMMRIWYPNIPLYTLPE